MAIPSIKLNDGTSIPLIAWGNVRPVLPLSPLLLATSPPLGTGQIPLDDDWLCRALVLQLQRRACHCLQPEPPLEPAQLTPHPLLFLPFPLDRVRATPSRRRSRAASTPSRPACVTSTRPRATRCVRLCAVCSSRLARLTRPLSCRRPQNEKEAGESLAKAEKDNGIEPNTVYLTTKSASFVLAFVRRKESSRRWLSTG